MVELVLKEVGEVTGGDLITLAQAKSVLLERRLGQNENKQELNLRIDD